MSDQNCSVPQMLRKLADQLEAQPGTDGCVTRLVGTRTLYMPEYGDAPVDVMPTGRTAIVISLTPKGMSPELPNGVLEPLKRFLKQ